jgi:hypothetical protein
MAIESNSKKALEAAMKKASEMSPQKMLCEAQLMILACAAAPSDTDANDRALEAAAYLIAYAQVK